MSGLALAREVLKISPATPVVLLSGFLREDELQHTLNMGVAEIVMKPTTYEHLGALIRALLDRRSAKQRAQVARARSRRLRGMPFGVCCALMRAELRW